MGKVLGFKEDYLYWSIIWQLTSKYDYQLITATENQQEIWLENVRNKEFPVIRLLRSDLDWANWLKRDIERTIQNGEQIRKKLYRKPLNVFNIYVTKFTPVDDYSFATQSFHYQKTKLQSFVLDSENFPEALQLLEKKLRMEFSIQLQEEEEQVRYLKEKTLAESVKKVKKEQQVFVSGKPFFTYIFIAIQVAVFLLMEISGGSKNSETLIEFGAKYSPYMLQGEWWRFFTPIVIHIGFIHLLMNTVSLYLIGSEVERIYGNTRFLFIYLLAGFTGTLASFVTTPNLAAGASGAIFGCFGALLYFGTVYPKLFFRTMGSAVIVLIMINLAYGFSVSGIDNAGHIGGLIGGFLAAGIVSLPKRKTWRQLIFLAGTAGLIYFLLQYGYNHPNSAALNDETMALVAQNYVKEGETAKASELLLDYTERHASTPISYFVLGNIYAEKGDTAEAKASYEKAIGQNPRFHEAYYNLALMHTREQEMEQAKKLVQKAIELDPSKKSYQKLAEQLAD
ncbi:rhomboid family intramembrane serine protease [Peribacillus sp. Hz7]|uniref:rhomboid family intramembrane serine protease n=1 Tax=Peribacillus sp. Hz7 TaxID=3344873 RepID=UPI0035CC512E